MQPRHGMVGAALPSNHGHHAPPMSGSMMHGVAPVGMGMAPPMSGGYPMPGSMGSGGYSMPGQMGAGSNFNPNFNPSMMAPGIPAQQMGYNPSGHGAYPPNQYQSGMPQGGMSQGGMPMAPGQQYRY